MAKSIGTAVVPANGNVVTLYACETCGDIYSQQETHEKYNLAHLAATGQR